MATATELLKHLVAITTLAEIFYQFWKEKASYFHGMILGFKTKIRFIGKDVQKHMYRHTE